jgi:hypothetical protein
VELYEGKVVKWLHEIRKKHSLLKAFGEQKEKYKNYCTENEIM